MPILINNAGAPKFGTSTTSLTSGGTGIIGTSKTLARSDHTHDLPAYPTLTSLGINVTTTEINYLSGVTSSIQTQLSTISNSILTINGRPKCFVSTTEPTGVSTNDIWFDMTNILIKVRTASSTWTSMGAVYLP